MDDKRINSSEQPHSSTYTCPYFAPHADCAMLNSKNTFRVKMCSTILSLAFAIFFANSVFSATNLNVSEEGEGNIENVVEFLKCDGDLENFAPSSDLWTVPEAITTDGGFTAFLKPGNITCNQDGILEVTLIFNSTELRSASFVSHGYFNLSKEFYKPNEFCISQLNDAQVAVRVCNTNDCGVHNPCLPKCCPLHKLLAPRNESGRIKTSCTEAPRTLRYFQPVLYDDPTTKSIENRDYHFYQQQLPCPKEQRTVLPYSGNAQAAEFYKRPGLCYRIRRNGTLLYRDMHFNWVEVNNTEYCIEGFHFGGPNGESFLGNEEEYGIIMCAVPPTKTRDSILHSAIIGLTLICSSVFLLLTFVTYLLLWKKNSISGMTTICHSTSMFFMYVCLGWAHILRLFPQSEFTTSVACEILGIAAHFFFLSSFCWLTAISFQLFRTFFRQQQPSRSASTRKFLRYVLFGWGLPGIMVIISVVVDHKLRLDPCNSFPVPSYGLRRKCFMDTAAMGLYVYYPVGFLLATNVILFFITAYKLYECQKSTKLARENLNQRQQMFKVMSRLFFVMGVTWIFEFVSWCHVGDNTNWYWVAVDIMNCLQAIAVFVIYVCKADVIRSVMKIVPVLKPCLSALLRCFGAKPIRRIDTGRSHRSTMTTSLRYSKSSFRPTKVQANLLEKDVQRNEQNNLQ